MSRQVSRNSAFGPLLWLMFITSTFVFTAEVESLDIEKIRMLLHDAEQAGMPSVEEAQCYVGHLSNVFSDRHLRLANGSWLVDLVETSSITNEAAKNLQAVPSFESGAPRLINRHDSIIPWRFALIHAARSIQFGDRQYARDLPKLHREYIAFGKCIGYPRAARPTDILLALRVECGEYLAMHRQMALLSDFVPAAWQGQVRAQAAARQAAAIGATMPIGNLRNLPDGDLVMAIADRTYVTQAPTQEVATRGEVALDELERRWRIDPAILAGRDPQAPWDVAEQAAVATALQGWWSRESEHDWGQRLTALASSLSIGRMLQVLEISSVGDRHAMVTNANNAPPWTTFSNKLAQVLVARLAVGPDDLTVKQLDQITAWYPENAAVQTALDGLTAPPGSGLSWSLAARLNQRGHPDHLDALVEQTLQHGNGNDTKAAVWIWATHPSAHRWERLRALEAGPATDAASRAVQAAAGYGASFTPEMQIGLPTVDSPMALGLALLALRDERRLAIELMPNIAEAFRQFPSQPANEYIPAMSILKSYRVADLALVHFRLNMVNLLSREFCTPFLGILSPSWYTTAPLTPSMETTDRDDYRARLVAYITPLVIHELQRAKLVVPESFTKVMPVGAKTDAVPDSQLNGLLTAAEATAIDSLHASCIASGLPDLAGAEFRALKNPEIWTPDGLFPFESESPVLIHFADGKALYNGVTDSLPTPDAGPMPSRIFDQRLELRPLPVDAQDPLYQSCSPDTATRLQSAGRLASFSLHPRWAMLAALAARWKGADTSGHALVSAAILQASVETGAPLVLMPTPGLYLTRPRGLLISPITMTSIEREARLAVGRWCVELASNTTNKAKRTALLSALATLADPRDRATLENEIHRRNDKSPETIRLPHPRNFSTSIRNFHPVVFNDEQVEYANGFDSSVELALSDSDLLNQLGNEAGVTWRQGGESRCVGDIALALLARRWGIDPRWAVVDDPSVRAVLPNAAQRHQHDDRLWQAIPWTPSRRTAVYRALMAWWNNDHTRSLTLDQRLAPLWKRLPAGDWCDYENGAELTTTGTSALATMIRQLPDLDPAARSAFLRRCTPALVTLKSNPTLTDAFTSIETTTWGRDICALRQFIHHDEVAWDALMHQALVGNAALPLTSSTTAEPLLNLGFFLAHPSKKRFLELKQVLGRTPDDPVMQAVLCRVGSTVWPLFGSYEELRRERLIPDDVRRGFSFAIALWKLNDVRALSPKAVAALADSGLQSAYWTNLYPPNNYLWPIERSPRVCDWVMTFLICAGKAPFDGPLVNKILGGDDGRQLNQQKDRFARASRDQRDVIIDHLKHTLRDELSRNASVANLIPLIEATALGQPQLGVP